MRMSNDRDQAMLRSAVSDAAANLLAFVPSLGTRRDLRIRRRRGAADQDDVYDPAAAVEAEQRSGCQLAAATRHDRSRFHQLGGRAVARDDVGKPAQAGDLAVRSPACGTLQRPRDGASAAAAPTATAVAAIEPRRPDAGEADAIAQPAGSAAAGPGTRSVRRTRRAIRSLSVGGNRGAAAPANRRSDIGAAPAASTPIASRFSRSRSQACKVVPAPRSRMSLGGFCCHCQRSY